LRRNPGKAGAGLGNFGVRQGEQNVAWTVRGWAWDWWEMLNPDEPARRKVRREEKDT